jgi:hypothetical protein
MFRACRYRITKGHARSEYLGFVVYKAAEYFVLLCQSFHRLLHNHHHHHHPKSRDGRRGHIVASVIVDSVPLNPKKRKKSRYLHSLEEGNGFRFRNTAFFVCFRTKKSKAK